jgi:molybdopterin-guanine dinucleotide biosynthesis protein A
LIEDAAGFVLAGGLSTRMGRDKAILQFAGRPLVARAADILRQAGLSASISGERDDLAEFAPIVADRVPGQGPLGGLYAALESTPARWAVFLPVDAPLLPPALIAYLLRFAQSTGAAVTISSVGGFEHTFPAVLDRSVLPTLRAELESGRRKCFSAMKAAAAALGQTMSVIAVEAPAQAGAIVHPAGLQPEQWFLNVNTPEEFATAESLAGGGIA